MILTGSKRKLLRESIINAYPNVGELEILLNESMDINLSTFYSGNPSYSSIVYNLIKQLQTEGRLEQFIHTLLKDKPKSPYLKEIGRLLDTSANSTTMSRTIEIPRMSKKILIVEDSVLAAGTLITQLNALGYEVVKQFDNGEEAVEQVEELQPDLVLMDIKLPGEIDGIEAAKQITAKLEIPILFLSAYSDSATLRKLPLEHQNYLVKPVSLEQLRTSLEIALREKPKYQAKILIVEDDLISADSLGNILKTLGHTVVGKVTNGKDALTEVNKGQPDLVLMDINIQGEQDGFEVSKQIQDIAQIPVIYITAYYSNQKIKDRLVEIDPNHNGFLKKPYNEEDIKTTIDIALAKHDFKKSDSDLPAYNLSEQTWYNKPIPTPIEITPQEDKHFYKDKIKLVIITATDVELRAVLRLLKPLPPKRKVRLLYEGPETYYLGKFGAFGTVITKCRMGAIGEGSVILATQQALSFWQPKAIIMVGIAFGKGTQEQKIADVLVAREIIPYESQKVGERIEYRAPIPPSNATLLNRFENVLDWEFKRPDGSPCTIHKGPILSGEKLINEPNFKAQLFQGFPTAIGGEMEGAGLGASAGRIGQPWILVKSICDWADGKKGDKHQALAAASATDLVHYVFSKRDVLQGL